MNPAAPTASRWRDWEDVEAELRAHVRTATGPRAGFYRRLVGEPMFWRGDQVLGMAAVEAEDEPSECQRVSLRAARTHGLGVVVGWVTAREHPPIWHCANVLPSTGELVDAARARRHGVGYLMKVLEPGEVSRLSLSASTPTPSEFIGDHAERWSETGRRLGHALDALFG